jgi:2-dehydropantoate 2-reductase
MSRGESQAQVPTTRGSDGSRSSEAADSILIVGTGAMASIFGVRLSRYADVTLLGTWEAGLAALQERGVRFVEFDGTEHTDPIRATSTLKECTGHRFALVLVKSWQTGRAARQLASCLAPDGVALTLQNGLGNLETLQEHLGGERVALGVTTVGATLLGPGHVRVGGEGPTYVVQDLRLLPITGLLQKAGFNVVFEDNLESMVWGKLVVNTGINPITALLDILNGELLESEPARTLLRNVAKETAEVARARGVNLPFDDPGEWVANVARQTATNRSSMLQDLRRGAPTEIDAISGAVVQEGERLGVHTPINATLWHLVRARVSSFNGE